MPICLRTDKNSCQYAYKYDPVAGITLPPERPRRWYRTTTYTDNDCANMHAIHQLTDHAYVPAIYRPTDRQALRSTTITTRRSQRTAIRTDKLYPRKLRQLQPLLLIYQQGLYIGGFIYKKRTASVGIYRQRLYGYMFY